MPHICPRPCSRLATAAVFIAVGVVQLIVGIILLKSKYVFLLAEPNFWTSCCNIAVGCLLGISASVWRESKNKKSTKYIIRRNILLALLFSALMINSTTLGIMLLSKGNTLLSIRLESYVEYSTSTFASEVFAYAYAASVCSPIVCIVVAIVAMSGSCFISSDRKNTLELQTSHNSLKKNRSQSFQWVYTPDQLGLSKKKELQVASTPDSSSDDETSEEASVYEKCATSVEDLQNVMHRMAEGKRDSIVNDSAIMLQQMDLRRKKKYDSLNRDGSYLGPVLQTKESSLSERICREDLNNDRSPCARNSKFYRHSLALDGNSHLLDDITLERINRLRNEQHRHSVALDGSTRLLDEAMFDRSNRLRNEHHHHSMVLNGNTHLLHDVNLELMRRLKNEQHRDSVALGGSTYVTLEDINRMASKQPNTYYRIPDPTDEVFNEHHNASSQMVEKYFPPHRNFRENLPIHTNINYAKLSSEHADQKEIPTVHKLVKTAKMNIEKKDLSPEHISFKRKREFSPDKQKIFLKCSETPKEENVSPVQNGCFSPEGSDFDADSFDLSRTSSWAGEMVPIKVSNATIGKLSQKLIPVPSPVVPTSLKDHRSPRSSENIMKSPSCTENTDQNSSKEKKANLSSFKENVTPGHKENLLEYPKVGSTKKYDLARVVTMASITEEPNSEASQTSADSSQIKGAIPKVPENHPNKKSSAHCDSLKGKEEDRESPATETTPKRKRSSSGKVLRKIWSSAGSEKETGFLDQVVDKDSLIGLTEEELIARQIRNRSIRKAIQQRIKKEMVVSNI